MAQVVHITVESSQPAVHGIAYTQPDWIHPHLIESLDPVKGRQFRASDLIPVGTRLLVDRPYAIIPVVDDPAVSDNLLCSNHACNRRTAPHSRSSCRDCIPDVVWCTSTCREADAARHGFECTWLKRFSQSIRAKRGEYHWGMLWVIVRLLAARHSEMHSQGQLQGAEDGNITSRPSHRSQHGWKGIESLCGSSDTWSHEEVRLWTSLVKKYLPNSPVLPHGMHVDRVLHLICQEEANSFGLYPRETGNVPTPPIDRGEQFAAAVYPTAAIANHSCMPNVRTWNSASLPSVELKGVCLYGVLRQAKISHKPDEQGRVVFTASREILPGEECCISYFDLTRFTDLTSRREHLRKSFRFICRCERCLSEEPVTETSLLEWLPMPLMDI